MLSDSSDELELLQPQAFSIEKSDKEINFSVPPTSGQEYLQRVQIEAKKCPAVVVANVDERVARRQKAGVVSRAINSYKLTYNNVPPTPAQYLPSLPWQLAQMADFSDTRQKFESLKRRVKQLGRKPSVALPNAYDAAGWCRLCFGAAAASDAADPLAGTVPPLLSIVSYMDQTTVTQVLQYAVNWLEVTGFSDQMGRWLYALLVCLEKPLTPEVCSLLRTMTRHCATIRASLVSCEDPQLVPLNLMICMVARYFDQKDLADPT